MMKSMFPFREIRQLRSLRILPTSPLPTSSIVCFIFIPTGHSEPDWGGAAAGPDQLLPQLHGAHQAAKEKVRQLHQHSF